MKEGGRQLSHEVLEKYRFRAVELRKKDWQINKIAEAFGVNRRAVTRWLSTYGKYGKSGLKSKKALGPEPKLKKEDRKKIISIVKKSAMEFGFETPLWNCKRLQQITKQKLKKELDISTIWRWLINWGLTNQKPDKQALERNERTVRKWLKEEWPEIQKHRRRWQAMLYFQDESAVSLTPVIGKTWALKGRTPKIKVTGHRGTICISSAVSPAGRMVFRIEKKTVTSKTFIEFLKQIIKNHPWRKIIIVVDNSPTHTAKAVEYFIEQNKNKIAIYYLPTYSPDLNPDEEVWNHLKTKKLKDHQARNKKDFKSLVLSKLRSMQKNSSLIKSFFFFYGL